MFSNKPMFFWTTTTKRIQSCWLSWMIFWSRLPPPQTLKLPTIPLIINPKSYPLRYTPPLPNIKPNPSSIFPFIPNTKGQIRHFEKKEEEGKGPNIQRKGKEKERKREKEREEKSKERCMWRRCDPRIWTGTQNGSRTRACGPPTFSSSSSRGSSFSPFSIARLAWLGP